MKRIITLAFILCLTSQVFAQTDGLTYQAVIINPSATDLPGVDSPDNFLPSTSIAIRFSIINGDNEQNPAEFQEVILTDTDEFGRVNVIIGKDNNAFRTINWDGETKLLKVEIDFEAGNDYTLISVEELTFLPYASHRDITASGTLTVDGNTFLNGELQVENPTNLNSSLDVNGNNPTNLSGTLDVIGETNLFDALNVNNLSPTNLTGSLQVGLNSNLDGTLDVLGATRLESTLDVLGATTLGDLTVNGLASFGDLNADALVVNQSTTLNNQINIDGTTVIDGGNTRVRIIADLPGNGNTFANHPLTVEGGNNGMAIRVNGSRSNDNNFISFFDTTNGSTMWGRIEGEIPSEFTNNADYNFDQTSLEFDVYDSEIDLGFAFAYEVIAGAQLIKASSDFRGCIGLGGCIASPGPVDIAFAGVELISAAVQVVFAALVLDRSLDNRTIYNNNKLTFQGVTYASGAGDYAEYLQRNDINEKMTYGDIIGVIGGKISKNLSNAERMMVVSYKPIVLGNMPQENRKQEYEKVAFMGQVPVKVLGRVSIGDYIIPSGKNDGTGIAISPSSISIKDINNIVGTAWSESNKVVGISMINVAVGLNRNDNNSAVQKLENEINTQAKQIAELENKIADILTTLSKLENSNLPNEPVIVSTQTPELDINNHDGRKYDVVNASHGDIIYWEITREDLDTAFNMAKKQMLLNGVDVKNNYLWKKIENDPDFKNRLLDTIKSRLDKQIHYHKEVEKTGKH